MKAEIKSLCLLLRGKPRQALRQLRNGWYLRSDSKGKKLHVGCGVQHKIGYVNIDASLRVAPDYISDAGKIPCKERTVGIIESYHVIEHIPHPALDATLRHWFDLLQPGGIVVAECPDFFMAAKQYVDGNRQRVYNVYGLQRYDGDTHYFGFDEASLREAFIQVGFVVTSVGPGTDYHSASEPCLRIEACKPVGGRLGV